MSERSEPSDNQISQQESCEKGISRQEFLKKVLTAAAATGAIVAGPRIVDKFLVPPVYAFGSKMSAPGAASDQPTGYGNDTTVISTA